MQFPAYRSPDGMPAGALLLGRETYHEANLNRNRRKNKQIVTIQVLLCKPTNTFTKQGYASASAPFETEL